MSEITRFPLVWPNNVPRTAPQLRTRPQFDERTFPAARDFVQAEINRLNKRRHDYNDDGIIISCNKRFLASGGREVAEPADPAVAVYFTLRFARNGKWHERPCVLSCDKWIRLGYNLMAIGKDIDAQRARERWGCTTVEQAFQGYLAIPEKCGGAAWWTVLGINPNASQSQVKDAYKAKALTGAHPDKGGTQETWLIIQTAYDQAMAQFR